MTPDPLNASRLDETDKIHMDESLRVLKTCKSLWKEKMIDLDKDVTDNWNQKFIDKLNSDKENETISAILSYKRGEHLKLIPFFKPQ